MKQKKRGEKERKKQKDWGKNQKKQKLLGFGKNIGIGKKEKKEKKGRR